MGGSKPYGVGIKGRASYQAPAGYASRHSALPIDTGEISDLDFRPAAMPQLERQASLAAMPCANDRIMVDRFANVRRIGSIIRATDTGEPIKPPQSGSLSMPH
jgi:hypothetical protein